MVDPVTGDNITLSEKASIIAQSLVRRWSVTVIHIAFSLFWWHKFWNAGFSEPVNIWMAAYSLIAVVNENILGIGFSSQAKRDALLLRKMNKVVEHQEHIIEKLAIKEGITDAD